MVRRHPWHTFRASRTQTLIQGDTGPAMRSELRSGVTGVELWGCLPYSSNLRGAASLQPKIRAAQEKFSHREENDAMNPLNSVRGAITTGVIVAIVVMLVVQPTSFHELGLARWLPILAGVMWIGLLYYFNVVQTPGLAAAAADKGGPGGAGISKYIAPRALFWFR